MVNWKSFLSVVALSLLVSACGDSDSSAPQQLADGSKTDEVSVRDPSSPRIVGLDQAEKLDQGKAERILNGDEALIIHFPKGEEINLGSMIANVSVEFDGKKFKCGPDSKVEGKEVHCFLQAESAEGAEIGSGANEERIDLSKKPAGSKLVVNIKQGKQEAPSTSESPAQQDFRQEVPIQGQAQIAVLSGNKELKVTSLENLTAPDSVVETYVVRVQGKVDEAELKNAVALVDPQGTERVVQDVTAKKADQGTAGTENPAGTEVGSGDANPSEEPTPTEESSSSDDSDIFALRAADHDIGIIADEAVAGPQGEEADDKPAAGTALEATDITIKIKKSDLMMASSEASPAPSAGESELVQGTFKLILKKGLKIDDKVLEQDRVLATIEVNTQGGTGEPAADASAIVPAEGANIENNQLSADQANSLMIEVRRGSENSAQLSEVDPSFFKIEQFEDAAYSIPKGEAWAPKSVKKVDENKVQLFFADEGGQGLTPGYYKISIPEEKLKDSNGKGIASYQFQVVDQAGGTPSTGSGPATGSESDSRSSGGDADFINWP